VANSYSLAGWSWYRCILSDILYVSWYAVPLNHESKTFSFFGVLARLTWPLLPFHAVRSTRLSKVHKGWLASLGYAELKVVVLITYASYNPFF
jgi:hypothetical protein